MSQNSLVLPTTGTLSGLAAVQGINAALDTLNTLASGSSAPSSPEAGQLWHDTGTKHLKIRSMDNTTWITLGALDESAYLFSAALGALAIPQSNIGGNFTFSGSSSGWYMSVPYGTGSGKFILQGGTTGSLPVGTNSINFPISFPTYCLGAVPGFNATGSLSNAVFTLAGTSASAFSVYNQSGGVATMTYIAAGV